MFKPATSLGPGKLGQSLVAKGFSVLSNTISRAVRRRWAPTITLETILAAQRRIFSSLALWTKQLFEGDGSPLEPQDCTLMKVSRRSHPLCPRRPKSVTSDLWRQVWPLHRCPFGNCMVTRTGQSELRRSGVSEVRGYKRSRTGVRLGLGLTETLHYESPSSVSRK